MCLLITNNYIERKKCLIYRKTDILYEKPGKFCKLYNVHKNIIFKKHMMRRSVGLNNHRSEQLTELVFLKFVNLTNFILKICEYLSTATHSRGEILRFFFLQVSSKLGVWPNLLFLTHLMSSAETPGFLINSKFQRAS